MGNTANTYTIREIVPYQSALNVPTGDEDFGFLVRVDAETLTMTINGTANAAPDAELIIQTNIYARTAEGRSRFGITTRAVIIKRLLGTAPLQFYLKRTVPWLQNNLSATLSENSPPTISYQGQSDWTYVGTREEKVGVG